MDPTEAYKDSIECKSRGIGKLSEGKLLDAFSFFALSADLLKYCTPAQNEELYREIEIWCCATSNKIENELQITNIAIKSMRNAPEFPKWFSGQKDDQGNNVLTGICLSIYGKKHKNIQALGMAWYCFTMANYFLDKYSYGDMLDHVIEMGQANVEELAEFRMVRTLQPCPWNSAKLGSRLDLPHTRHEVEINNVMTTSKAVGMEKGQGKQSSGEPGQPRQAAGKIAPAKQARGRKQAPGNSIQAEQVSKEAGQAMGTGLAKQAPEKTAEAPQAPMKAAAGAKQASGKTAADKNQAPGEDNSELFKAKSGGKRTPQTFLENADDDNASASTATAVAAGVEKKKKKKRKARKAIVNGVFILFAQIL